MTAPARFAIVTIVTTCLTYTVLRTNAAKLPELVGEDGKPRQVQAAPNDAIWQRIDADSWIQKDRWGDYDRRTKYQVKEEKTIEHHEYMVKEATKLTKGILAVIIIIPLIILIGIIVLCVCVFKVFSRPKVRTTYVYQGAPSPYPANA